MSGAEVITVVGLISSIITLIETSRNLYDAATDATGLHEAFRLVSRKMSLVLNILRDCEKVQKIADDEYAASNDVARKSELEKSSTAVRAIMEICDNNVRKLQEIFEKVVPGDDAGWFERYRKAAKAQIGKKQKVEDYMKDILENLQLLHENQFFKGEIEKRSKGLKEAIQELEEVPPSLTEDEGRYSHSGAGPMNINAGKGTQRNYNQSGSNSTQTNVESQIVQRQ